VFKNEGMTGSTKRCAGIRGEDDPLQSYASAALPVPRPGIVTHAATSARKTNPVQMFGGGEVNAVVDPLSTKMIVVR
jgi:hypothetical protein